MLLKAEGCRPAHPRQVVTDGVQHARCRDDIGDIAPAPGAHAPFDIDHVDEEVVTHHPADRFQSIQTNQHSRRNDGKHRQTIALQVGIDQPVFPGPQFDYLRKLAAAGIRETGADSRHLFAAAGQPVIRTEQLADHVGRRQAVLVGQQDIAEAMIPGVANAEIEPGRYAQVFAMAMKLEAIRQLPAERIPPGGVDGVVEDHDLADLRGNRLDQALKDSNIRIVGNDHRANIGSRNG